MEELEPRLLFSADLPGVLAQSGLLGGEAEPTPPAIVALVDAPAVGVTIGNSEESNTESGFSLSQPKSSTQVQKELVFVDAGAPELPAAHQRSHEGPGRGPAYRGGSAGDRS